MKIITSFWRDIGLLAFILILSTNALAQNGQSIHSIEQLQNAVKYSQSLRKADLLDRSYFIRSSRLKNVTLSPATNYLSYMIKEGREQQKLTSLWLYDIKQKEHQKLFTFKDLMSTYWSKDGRHIFLKLSYGIAVSKVKSSTNTPQRLLTIRAKKKERFLGIDYSQPSSFLVKLWNDKAKHFEIVSINESGAKNTLLTTTADFLLAETNLATGNISLIARRNQADDNKGEVFFYDLNEAQERKIWQCDWDDNCSVINYDRASKTLTLISNKNSNFLRPIRVNLETKTITEIHSDPQSFGDLANIQSILKNNKFVPAIATYHGDFFSNYALNNDENHRHLDKIKERFADTVVKIDLPLFDNQQSYWLLVDLDNRSALPRYYLFYKLASTIEPILLDAQQQADQDIPLMSNANISPTYAVSYRARDGFKLQGYLTLPRGIAVQSAPLVVDVHGGPWSRSEGGFSKSTEFLANRGYIVFRPNFRASTGLGKAYKFGTKQDFGDGTSQNDIVDGTRFLLDNSIGDPNRVAITGHSFGGFSTLSGLSFTPRLFKVGFAGAPPSSVARSAKYYWRFSEKLRREHNDYFMKQTVVDWDDPIAFKKHEEKTPDNNIGNIEKPLVIWAGKHDRRVFIADVKDYASRLQEKNKNVMLFVDPKALHSPRGRQSLMAYLYLKEKTLAEHIGGALQPLDEAKDKALIRFINKNTLIKKMNTTNHKKNGLLIRSFFRSVTPYHCLKSFIKV